MNCQETNKPRQNGKKPIEIRDGSVLLKIYRGRCVKQSTTYPLFTLVYHEGGKRCRKAFGNEESARKEAQKIAGRLARGETDVLKLKNSDQQAFVLATRELQPVGVPLLEAVRQYVAAVKALPVGASIVEAAREYTQRHPLRQKSLHLSRLVDEFLVAKKQDGASDVYLRTLRYHLNPMKERFRVLVCNVTSADLEDWLRGVGHSPRTRRNIGVSLTTLFNYARSRGYLPKGVPTEAEGVSRPRGKAGRIEILVPEELQSILHAADTAERKIYFALGAFTGTRAAELVRLDWSAINLIGRHVEIAADKAKTASRRLVPICDALYAWLEPFAKKQGKIFTSQRSAERLVEWAGKKIGRWPKNALRHSFVSYRVAQTQSVAQVALEAGNSPQMIFANYRELVTKEAADKWFSVVPRQNS